jgi:hypothetical protein
MVVFNAQKITLQRHIDALPHADQNYLNIHVYVGPEVPCVSSMGRSLDKG